MTEKSIISEKTIKSLASLDLILEETKKSFGRPITWWRGHGQATWSLQAPVFRRHVEVEQALIGHFMMRASSRLGHRKIPTSQLEWLFLAQHYGLPTRLLDWSENVLVALYFAVENKALEMDGCLWAMSAENLNRIALGDSYKFLAPSHELAVQDLVCDAFDQTYTEKNESKPYPCLALATQEIDERMLAQSSAFTVHASSHSLENLKKAENCLRKFIIPASEKQNIRELLYKMGIRKWNLFPDLTALASELSSFDFGKPPINLDALDGYKGIARYIEFFKGTSTKDMHEGKNFASLAQGTRSIEFK